MSFYLFLQFLFKSSTFAGEDGDQAEARNDEVIRRVAEMKQILDAAEEYLEDDGEATDAESVVTQKSGTESELSSNYGKLKHSDSLLLLTQVRITWSRFLRDTSKSGPD